MKEKVAIMMSGGLDSFISYYFAKIEGYEPIPIWVDIGQPYKLKELNSLARFDFETKKIVCNVLREEFGNLPTVESWIIPGRNLLFATIGAMFGDKVWICALMGEQHEFAKEHDKSLRFYKDTSRLLTYVFNIARPETVVETPFRSMNKTDIVAWALDHGITKEQLKSTSSCYDGKKGNCGKCGTCFKRWLAFKNNGIDETYESNPWENEYARRTSIDMDEASEKNDFSHYDLPRVIATMSALRMVVNVEDYIKESKRLLNR